MLSDRYSSRLPELLIPAGSFHPFPTCSERKPWERLSDSVRRRLIQAGEEFLGWRWPALPTTLFMDFSRTGSRKNYEIPYFARRDAFALTAPTKDIVLSLMTPAAPRIAADDTLRLSVSGADLALCYDGSLLHASVEEIPVEDDRLRGWWGEKVFRVLLSAKEPLARGKNVLRIARAG